MTAVIEADRIGKRYGDLTAVDELSFSAGVGEILGVLGPNGAGKTTAIRILTTILAPTRGSFTVAGLSHTQPVELRRRIGVLPESAGYPERQTGDEYLRFHARLFGHTARSARSVATDLLAEVGLADRAHSQIAAYSRGMRQRLGIARALVGVPEVVFLDEPTLGLDPAGQRDVLALVRSLATERGTTVLVSTHLLAEVEEICTRVLILHRGRVRAEGTVAEVARQAAAAQTARLRVPDGDVEQALGVLRSVGSVARAEADPSRPGWIALTHATDGNGERNAAVYALVAAGTPLLAFEVEQARLSDAFLDLTEAA